MGEPHLLEFTLVFFNGRHLWCSLKPDCPYMAGMALRPGDEAHGGLAVAVG